MLVPSLWCYWEAIGSLEGRALVEEVWIEGDCGTLVSSYLSLCCESMWFLLGPRTPHGVLHGHRPKTMGSFYEGME